MINLDKIKVINVVADIGGTNIRFAVTENNKLREIVSYECAIFPSLIAVFRCYLEENKLTGNRINACLAIACPVDDDLISMTNLPWSFSQKALKSSLDLNNLMMINDYTAIAMAIPRLTDEQKVKIGGGEATVNKAISVCGPGTGLGVANLVPINNSWHCLSGEGGHTDFAPVDDTDIQILEYLKAMKHRVSYEQLLSGYGLEQIYQALATISNKEKSHDKAAELYKTELTAKVISTQGINGTCLLCEQALSQFCKILGSFAGNLALITGSLGGVYIAGGIVPRFVDFIRESTFRARFEAKGRMSYLNLKTPTYIITESQPGLIGAAAYLHQFD